jgi:hypothetical protein
VDNLERRRHQRIVEVQGNRNPFIDRPGFAIAIWVSRPALSKSVERDVAGNSCVAWVCVWDHHSYHPLTNWI